MRFNESTNYKIDVNDENINFKFIQICTSVLGHVRQRAQIWQRVRNNMLRAYKWIRLTQHIVDTSEKIKSWKRNLRMQRQTKGNEK